MTESADFPLRSSGPAPYVVAGALDELACLRHAFGGRRGTVEEALGLPRAPFTARQVHGDTVLPVVADGAGGAPPEADALITDRRGVPLAVFTADCVPTLICDARTPALGVVHAGWRGTALGAVGKTVRALTARYGTRPEDCCAAVGPAIAPGCYEVGPDVRDAFVAGLPDGASLFRPGRAGRWWADLREATRRQLLASGVPGDRIAVCPYCTHCAADWFHSARRDGSAAGRQSTVAVLR
ncbi:MAG: peptidoglycan editing factor PgeF [bacterium]